MHSTTTPMTSSIPQFLFRVSDTQRNKSVSNNSEGQFRFNALTGTTVVFTDVPRATSTGIESEKTGTS